MSWSYATSFAIVMGLCGARLHRAHRGDAAEGRARAAARIWAALLLFAVSPLVLGSLFGTRYDLWPALLALAGLAAARRASGRSSRARYLGSASPRSSGRASCFRSRSSTSGGAAARRLRQPRSRPFAVVAAACFVPFAILEPHGLWSSLSGQFDRPLQVESLGAAVLMAAEHLGMAVHATINDARRRRRSPAGNRARRRPLDRGRGPRRRRVSGSRYARRRRTRRDALLMAAAATVAALSRSTRCSRRSTSSGSSRSSPSPPGRRGHRRGADASSRARPHADVVPRALLGPRRAATSRRGLVPPRRDLALVALAAALAGLQPRMRLRRRKSTFAGRSASLRMR